MSEQENWPEPRIVISCDENGDEVKLVGYYPKHAMALQAVADAARLLRLHSNTVRGLNHIKQSVAGWDDVRTALNALDNGTGKEQT